MIPGMKNQRLRKSGYGDYLLGKQLLRRGHADAGVRSQQTGAFKVD